MGTKETPSQPDTEEKEMTYPRIDPGMTQMTQLVGDGRKPGMAHKRPKWLIRCAAELCHRLKSSDWARAQSSGLRQARGRQSSGRPNGARTFLSAKRSGDFPVPDMAGWKTRPPVIDLSAGLSGEASAKTEALAKAEADARETDKVLKARPPKLEERRRKILEKLGV